MFTHVGLPIARGLTNTRKAFIASSHPVPDLSKRESDMQRRDSLIVGNAAPRARIVRSFVEHVTRRRDLWHYGS